MAPAPYKILLALFVVGCQCEPAQDTEPTQAEFSYAKTTPSVEVSPQMAGSPRLIRQMLSTVTEALSQPTVAPFIETLTKRPCWPALKEAWCGDTTIKDQSLTLDFRDCSAEGLGGQIRLSLFVADSMLQLWFDRFRSGELFVSGGLCLIWDPDKETMQLATCGDDNKPSLGASMMITDNASGQLLACGFVLTAVAEDQRVLLSGTGGGSVWGGQAVPSLSFVLGGETADKLDDPIVIPIPATCSCASSGTIAVTGDVHVDGNITELVAPDSYSLELTVPASDPLTIEATFLASFSSKDPDDCDSYAFAVPKYKYQVDGVIYIEQGLTELQIALDSAYAKGLISKESYKYWAAVFAEGEEAEAMGCPAVIEADDIEQALIRQTEKAMAKLPQICQSKGK